MQNAGQTSFNQEMPLSFRVYTCGFPQNHNIQKDKSFERVQQFKYLGKTPNKNSIHEEIRNRSKSGNAFYHPVQNLLSSSLLSNNLKIKIYRTIILPAALYGCETWSLILREERKLIVFENRVLTRIFGPKRDEVAGEWRKLHNEVLNDLYRSPNIVLLVWETGKLCTQGLGGET